MKRVIDGNVILQQDGALMLTAFNTVQLLRRKTPIFQNGPEFNSDDDEI